MKTRTLTIHVAAEEAQAYETASPELQQEIDEVLRRKLRETLRRVTQRRAAAESRNLSPDAARIMSLAGSWADMPEEAFASLVDELAERRRHAGSGRRRHEAGLD